MVMTTWVGRIGTVTLSLFKFQDIHVHDIYTTPELLDLKSSARALVLERIHR